VVAQTLWLGTTNPWVGVQIPPGAPYFSTFFECRLVAFEQVPALVCAQCGWRLFHIDVREWLGDITAEAEKGKTSRGLDQVAESRPLLRKKKRSVISSPPVCSVSTPPCSILPLDTTPSSVNRTCRVPGSGCAWSRRRSTRLLCPLPASRCGGRCSSRANRTMPQAAAAMWGYGTTQGSTRAWVSDGESRRGAGCVKSVCPDLWEARWGNLPGYPEHEPERSL